MDAEVQAGAERARDLIDRARSARAKAYAMVATGEVTPEAAADVIAKSYAGEGQAHAALLLYEHLEN